MSPASASICAAGTIAGAVTVLTLAAVWLIRDNRTSEELDQSLYCEMVSLHKQNPRLGWPDYKGTFRKECKDYEVKKPISP